MPADSTVVLSLSKHALPIGAVHLRWLSARQAQGCCEVSIGYHHSPKVT